MNKIYYANLKIIIYINYLLNYQTQKKKKYSEYEFQTFEFLYKNFSF